MKREDIIDCILGNIRRPITAIEAASLIYDSLINHKVIKEFPESFTKETVIKEPREFWVALNKDGKPVHVTDSKDIADAYDHAYPFTKIVVREVLPEIPEEKLDGIIRIRSGGSLKNDNMKSTPAARMAIIQELMDPPIDEETGIKPDPLITLDQVKEILNLPMPEPKPSSELQEMLDKISVGAMTNTDSLFYDDLKPLLQKMITKLEDK